MAIVPLLINLARELETDYQSNIGDFDDFFDDDFGFGIHPIDIFRPSRPSLLMRARRRALPYDRRRSASLVRRGGALQRHSEGSKEDSLMPFGSEGFQVCMDVSKFKPNELTVKTLDNTVVVEGKHEEREDEHGMIQRHFVRKYTLPKDYDAKEVVSTISSDGILTVKAPPPPNKAVKQNERIVQIQQTGPAHLSVKALDSNEQQQDKSSGVDASQNGAVVQNKAGK